MANSQQYTPRPPGFVVDGKLISFIGGLIGLAVMGWTGITYVNTQDFRLQSLESDFADLSTEVSELSDQVDTLNSNIVQMTILLNRLNLQIERINEERP